jgi:hypothetical protein
VGSVPALAISRSARPSVKGAPSPVFSPTKYQSSMSEEPRR